MLTDNLAVRRQRIVACAMAVLLTPAALLAQSAPAPDAATLARYDKNANGVLDANELAAQRADQAAAAAAVQTTATPRAAGDEEVIQMSPFEVSGAGDVGYYASNTLSGTRLNSKLEDLGASITVVTKQQMQDFALLDVNDIFLYEASTEGTGNYTSFEVDRNGVVIDNVAGDPNSANRIRGIGSANIARGNFGMSGRLPIDPIDMDSVEISRGPNSNIFGLGNASGTVNIIPARANDQRDFTTAEVRGDSYGGMRGSLDVNRPIVKGKLAVRASGVWQQDEFERKPSVARSERYNGMITWRPFRETTLRGQITYYENYARRPNAILPRDGFSYWEQSGRPVWDAATWSTIRDGVTKVVPYNSNSNTENAAFGPGLESMGTNIARAQIWIEPDGSIPVWMPGRINGINPTTGIATPDYQSGNQRFIQTGPAPRPGPLWPLSFSITDKGIYDWSSINLAAPNWSQNRVRNYTVELEQFFLRSTRQLLGMQLGWMREEADNYNRSFIGTGGSSPMVVLIDVNKTLPNGQPNPGFQRPYLNALEPATTRNPFFRDTFRGQLAYQLSLSRESNWLRWLGDHQFSGYGEYKNQISANHRYRDVIVSDHPWLAAGTNRGAGPTVARGYYRYYVGDAQGGDIDYSPPAFSAAHGTYNLNWYNAALGQWVNEPATIGEAFYQVTGDGGARRRNVIKTTGAVMQNHFFRDRIVTTFGIREDTSYNRYSTALLIGPDGIRPDLGTERSWLKDWLRRDGRTETKGVVVKPFRDWTFIDRTAAQGGVLGFLADTARSLTVHYNKSDSFVPADIAQNLMLELLPDPKGKGEDYGFAVAMFKNSAGQDMLVFKYNQYENTQVNSRQGDSGTIATRAARIDFSNTSGGSDRFNLYRNAREWWTQTWNDQGIAFTEEELEAAVAEQMGFEVDRLARYNAYPKSDTSDVTSKGKEIEVNFNPNRYVRMKVTAAQNKSVDNRLSPAIMEYVNMRIPVWETIIDPRTNTPWFTTRYGNDTAQNFLNNVVLAPYKLATANEGKTKSQIREWRLNAFGSLQLAALTSNKYLSRMSVSGAVRWEDQASIGYYTFEDDPNAFDPNRKIYDKAHTYIDAGISYNQRVWNDRVRMRVQLNVRNLTEGGRLQPVAAAPNGVPHSYRIIDPRQFILTVGFDL